MHEVSAHEVNPGVLQGLTVVTRDGKRAGKVSRLLPDQQPRWAAVTSGLLNSYETLVPLTEAQVAGTELRVPHRKARLESAPWEAGELSGDREAALCSHYDLAYDSSLTYAGPASSPGQDPDAGAVEVIRSEERLRVRMEQVSRRYRVRKRIVTEMRQVTVPVRREEFEFEPLPDSEVGQPAGGPAPQDLELVLHEERPVITMQTVPVERVRVRVERVTEQRMIQEELRREVVDTEER